MKLAKFANSRSGQLVVIGLMGAVAIYYTQKKAVEAAAVVGDAVNPNSQNNIVYQGVNAVGGTLTGNENFNFGSWLFDVFNPAPEERAEEDDMIKRIGG